jgi:hypothetical protein
MCDVEEWKTIAYTHTHTHTHTHQIVREKVVVVCDCFLIVSPIMHGEVRCFQEKKWVKVCTLCVPHGKEVKANQRLA